jgi:hypothetical protein
MLAKILHQKMIRAGLDDPEREQMAESPFTMSNIEHIRDLLGELLDRQAQQIDILGAIQNELFTSIKSVEKAVENLHSSYRSMHEAPTGNAHRAA